MKINLANIKKARNLLNKRECVAVPTETVYGIAGNAYSDTACKKIFRLKKRPMNNPLIIHYYDLKKNKLNEKKISIDGKTITKSYYLKEALMKLQLSSSNGESKRLFTKASHKVIDSSSLHIESCDHEYLK